MNYTVVGFSNIMPFFCINGIITVTFQCTLLDNDFDITGVLKHFVRLKYHGKGPY